MRKRTKRKVWSIVNPIEHAINGASITSRKMLNDLLLRELSSLDLLVSGRGTIKEWSDMVAVNNITQTLAVTGVGHEAMKDAHEAEAGLIDAAERYQRTGRMGLSGKAFNALREVIAWHDLQRSSISRSQYEEAIRLTSARVSSGHATIDLAETLGKPINRTQAESAKAQKEYEHA